MLAPLGLQFHVTFLSFDAGERKLNYIISGASSWLFWVFLHGFGRYNQGLLGPMFSLQMLPPLDLQFHFAFLSFDTREGKLNYISSVASSWSFWVFLHGFESYN